ncbi:hypothetical protein SDC9_80616 [bioreactor metagenome]|uniref:Uncharacterized protein n=1 Tax=bioreactor metagenome TaxID=1076179 RepID=A0A644YZH7_9ZZZZ
MFLCSQHGLFSVRMMWKQGGKHFFIHFPAVAGERHVFFFVNGFKLCMETADYVVLKTVRLNFCPVLDLVRRDIFRVNRHVETCIGVGSRCSNGFHQFIVLVWNGQFGCSIRDTVNLFVNCPSPHIVFRSSIFFEQVFYLLQHRLFLCIILRSELLCTLKHQMFKIVSQPGGRCRIVFPAHAYGNVGLNAGSLRIHTHINFQSVIQGVNTRVDRIIGNCLVLQITVLREYACGNSSDQDNNCK